MGEIILSVFVWFLYNLQSIVISTFILLAILCICLRGNINDS